ncbi:MAG: hypothetical protein WEB87_05010 [Bacteriovoracaceae bacterium]
MFSIFIFDPNTERWWAKVQGRYIPSTCRALADRVEAKQPADWTIECPHTDRLVLTVSFDENYEDLARLRANIYRSMANNLKKFSRFANPETLQNLAVFEIFMVHDNIKVWGQTDGQAMVQLRNLKTKDKIAKHLELTVKVKETGK